MKEENRNISLRERATKGTDLPSELYLNLLSRDVIYPLEDKLSDLAQNIDTWHMLQTFSEEKLNIYCTKKLDSSHK